jgi:hypothetical protein
MKTVLILSICVLLFADTTYGQAGAIGLYVDAPTYVDCYYTDAAPALVPVYVVHKLTPGATASQFMVAAFDGFNCTYTGEIIAAPVSIGSTQTGLSASYGGCMAGDILIATINYFCMGTSPNCARLQVVPDPAAPTGHIEVVDCAFVKLIATGLGFVFNEDGSCNHYLFCHISTKNTSWGRVKALYR